MEDGIFVILFCLISCGLCLRDYDIDIVGFNIENTGVEVNYREAAYQWGRYTRCDAEVNGQGLQKRVHIYTTSWRDDYETCVIRYPSSAKPVQSVKVIIESRLKSWQFNNATRWDLDFDITTAPSSTRVMFGKVNSYEIEKKQTLKNGRLEINGIFKMNYTASQPLYTSFRFNGINSSAPTEVADVRMFANTDMQFDDRVLEENTIMGDTIRSKIKIQESLVKSSGGTRGLMYFGAIFQVTPYLKMTGSIDIGSDIYTLYDNYNLFPFGTFAMLEPPESNAVVTLKRNQYNMIPCLTIGATQFDFVHPSVYKVNPDGSFSDTTFKKFRMIIGPYYHESSPLLYGDTDGVEGKYACQLTYLVETDTGRKKKSVTRIFEVKVEN